MANSWKRAVFLDRDGVINIDTGYPHRIDEFVLIPGAAAAIRRANEAGYSVFVVTNQGGIGLGYFSVDTLTAFHDHMISVLEAEKAIITDIAFCPHHPKALLEENRDCDCRKPKPAMILDLAERHHIDLAASAMIGDRDTDIMAAEAAGVRGFLFDGVNLDHLMQDVLNQLSGRAA